MRCNYLIYLENKVGSRDENGRKADGVLEPLKLRQTIFYMWDARDTVFDGYPADWISG
jgi:hypothetical protein